MSIEGDPDDLIREIRAAERAVEKFGRSGATAGATASAGMTRASRAATLLRRAGIGAAGTVTRLGSAAKTAAPYLTAGLAFGLFKAVEEAREANKVMAQTDAVIKSTGGAANVSAKDLADYAQRLSEISGQDDELIQKGGNLLLTFRDVRNEAGRNNDIFDQTLAIALDMSAALDQDLKSSIIQVGKALNDPTVGLTALRRVGVTFTDQQAEMITKLYESGDALGAQKQVLRELTKEFEGSAKAQADPIDRIGVVLNNLAEDVGLKVLPALSDVSNEISDILSAKNLTGEEKAERLAKLFERLGIDAIEGFERIAPDVARIGAKLGVRLALGLGKAFLEADALGKLFLGAAFIRAVGGPGVFGKLGGSLGRLLGRAMGARVATTVATEAAAASATGAAARSWKGAGLKIGRLIGPGILAGIILTDKGLREQIGRELGEGDPGGALDALQEGILGVDVPGIEDFGEGAHAGIQSDDGKAVIGEPRQLPKWWLEQRRGLRDAQKEWAQSSRQWEQFWRHQEREADRGGKRTNRTVGDNLRQFSRELDRSTDRGKRSQDELSRSADRMAGKVGGSYSSLAAAVGSGLQSIRDNTNRALDAYGVKALDFQIGKPADRPGGPTGQGGRRTFSRGGLLPGYSTVDDVPAVLRRGEAVLTPETHQPIVNSALMGMYGMTLPDLFRATGAQMFKKGGVARPAPRVARAAPFSSRRSSELGAGVQGAPMMREQLTSRFWLTAPSFKRSASVYAFLIDGTTDIGLHDGEGHTSQSGLVPWRPTPSSRPVNRLVVELVTGRRPAIQTAARFRAAHAHPAMRQVARFAAGGSIGRATFSPTRSPSVGALPSISVGGLTAPDYRPLAEQAQRIARRQREREQRMGRREERIAESGERIERIRDRMDEAHEDGRINRLRKLWEERQDERQNQRGMRRRQRRSERRQAEDTLAEEVAREQIEVMKDLRSEMSGLRRDVREGAQIDDRAFQQWLADRLDLKLGDTATRQGQLATAGVGGRF